MADQQHEPARTVGARVKINGRWRQPGETVHLSDAEAETYAHALEGGDGGADYLPGQEPQEPTPIAPITEAQAEAGDELAEFGASVRDKPAAGYAARVMTAKPSDVAYLPGQEPQAPTHPSEPSPAATPLPDEPQAPTPSGPVGTVTHTGGGWYEVRTASGVEKVQGKEAAEAAAARGGLAAA